MKAWPPRIELWWPFSYVTTYMNTKMAPFGWKGHSYIAGALRISHFGRWTTLHTMHEYNQDVLPPFLHKKTPLFNGGSYSANWML